MGTDMSRARRVLRATGAPESSLAGLKWPFGRQRRLHTLLRRRLAVLEGKNAVVELLFSSQMPLAQHSICTLEQVSRTTGSPEVRRLVLSLGVTRRDLTAKLSPKFGTEVIQSLDQVLTELMREGVVLCLPAKDIAAREDLYLAVFRGPRPRYDVADLAKLLRQVGTPGAQLRQRSHRESTTDGSRSYDL